MSQPDLDTLIRAQGITRYGLFFCTGEGNYLPDGSEIGSGYVIAQDGAVYAYWTGWDTKAQRLTFETWEQIQPEPDWLEEAEYRNARKQAGLC
jgi:hypothetical protein